MPGDITIQRDRFTFYFPFTTCIVISVSCRLSFTFLDGKISLIFLALMPRPTHGISESHQVARGVRKFEEAKRRKREGMVILVTALMVVALIFFEVQLPEYRRNTRSAAILFFFC